jgi:hypothetical protein
MGGVGLDCPVARVWASREYRSSVPTQPKEDLLSLKIHEDIYPWGLNLSIELDVRELTLPRAYRHRWDGELFLLKEAQASGVPPPSSQKTG